MDHMCDSFDSVASGIAHWLHDGWGHSYPAGHRHCRRADPSHSGTKNIVAIWTLAGEGEVFGKEVVSRSRKILPNLFDTFSRKGLAMNPFTIKFTGRSNLYEKEKFSYPLFSASYADRHPRSLCIDTHT